MKQITIDGRDINRGTSGLLKKLYLSDYNENNIEPFQLKALRDLEDFVSDIPLTLNFLFDRWFVRWDKVTERGGYGGKPRITLYPQITTKGNLALSWKPTGKCMRGGINETDFDELYSDPYTYQKGHFARPECELLFIHNFHSLIFDISKTTPDSNISALLIGAACAAMESFRDFLPGSFEVTTKYWFELAFDKGTICKFEIVNISERKAEQEKEWVNGFQSQYGIEPREFITLFKDQPSSVKVSKALKEKGINIDAYQVRCVAERLRSLHSVIWSDDSVRQDNSSAAED